MKRRFEKLRPEILQARTAAWFLERIDLGPAIAFLAKKTVPIHRLSWIYLLGGAALFLVGLQVLTGCLLMLYYQPTQASAYESIREIITKVPYGWLIRGVHVWGAHLFIAIVCLHFLTVLFTRAYRKPRELTWISGILMLFVVLGLGFTGYLLPWNELSYSATRVGTELPGAVPIVGDFIVHCLRGGDQVTGDTLTRFFAAHVIILPLVLGFLLLIHVGLIQLQGMSLPLGMAERKVKDDWPFFTEFALVDACVWLALFGLIATLAVFLPSEMGLKADPLKPSPEGIKPEWYFLFMFETLKVLPAYVFGGQTPAEPFDVEGRLLGVAFFALVALFFLLLPFSDRGAMREKRSPGFTVLFTVLLVYAVVFEVRALLSPGAEHGGEEAIAQTFSLSGSIVSLALLWSVIGFLIFYLRQLLKENIRVRKLYQADCKG